MSRDELVDIVRGKTGHTKQVVKLHMDAILNAMRDRIAVGETVELRNFGVFSVQQRKARRGRNVHTGEPVGIPARPVVRFRPSGELDSRVKECRVSSRAGTETSVLVTGTKNAD